MLCPQNGLFLPLTISVNNFRSIVSNSDKLEPIFNFLEGSIYPESTVLPVNDTEETTQVYYYSLQHLHFEESQQPL